MAIVHIKFQDTEEGVKVNFISDAPLPNEVTEWTAAQLLARQTSEAIDMLIQEKTES